jgi:hypothetical protein
VLAGGIDGLQTVVCCLQEVMFACPNPLVLFRTAGSSQALLEQLAGQQQHWLKHVCAPLLFPPAPSHSLLLSFACCCCFAGMLVDLATKLGASLAKDAEGLRRNLSSVVGGSSSGSAASWRSSPAPAASSAPAAAASGDRWSKYSAGSTQAASWRRSGSHNASGSKLSASDLSILRIDDLQDLVKKTGAQLPREATKDGVISALISKGVSLNECTRGEWQTACMVGGLQLMLGWMAVCSFHDCILVLQTVCSCIAIQPSTACRDVLHCR